MHFSKSKKEAGEKLEAKVISFEKNYSPSAGDLADHEEAKVELEKIYSHITNGIIPQSKSQWYKKAKMHLSIFWH